MKTKILLVALISATIFGCTKEESGFSSNSTTTQKSNQENSGRLEDETLLWKSLETLNYSREVDNLPDGVPGSGDATFLIIVQWKEWGRKKIKCQGGGLCEAEWFPEFKERLNPDGGGDTPPPLQDHAFAVKYQESSQQYYIDILVKYPMPSVLPATFSVLPIDADIVLDTENILGLNLTLSAGRYNFNQGLAPFGGYRIYLN